MEKATQELELIGNYFADITPQQWQQLKAIGPVYADWNTRINVISRKDIDSLYQKHVLHSLAIAAVFNFSDGMEVIDIGTGGGFPGIPLAIFFPEAKFHLVDSIAKKLKVVEAVAEAAELKNVTIQHIRAEEIKQKKFDCAVSRAVAPLGTLWQWAKPLLRKQKINTTTSEEGIVATGLICLKGGDLAQEIADSGCRPRMMDIASLFPEAYFDQKFLLHVAW